MTVNSREIEHEASAMLYYYIPPHKQIGTAYLKIIMSSGFLLTY